MTPALARIERFPIKSIGGELLDRVTLGAGACLPGDRAFAVLHADAARHLNGRGGIDTWLPKSQFLRGVAGPELQAIRGARLPDGRLRLTHPRAGVLDFDPEDDAAALLAWLEPLWPGDRPRPLRLVAGPQPLTDMRQGYVSILSLASLAALEARLGRPLGCDRWRANFWIEGLEPFAERDWIGRTLRIGDAQLVVRQRIGRCDATSADTGTGRHDIDMPAALKSLQGDADFGIYAEVLAGAPVGIGAPVEVLP